MGCTRVCPESVGVAKESKEFEATGGERQGQALVDLHVSNGT